jgi:hypothetical protein
MTSNTTPVPYVASASDESSGFEAYRAFNRDSNYGWDGFGATGWLQLDFGIGSTKHLGRYTLVMENFFAFLFPGRTPRNFTMSGSADLLTWDILDTRTDQLIDGIPDHWTSFFVAGGVTRKTYVCNSPTGLAYRYYRLDIQANNNGVIPFLGVADHCQVTDLILGSSYNLFY